MKKKNTTVEKIVSKAALCVLACCLAIPAANVRADVHDGTGGYIPLIRRDRVWEYVQRYSSSVWEVYHLAFDGTEDIDGTTYHILRYKSGQKWNIEPEEDGKPVYTGEMIEETTPDKIYLMREEKGKVWIRLSDEEKENLHTGEDEIMLYDFTLGEGESYTTAIYCMDLLYLDLSSDGCSIFVGEEDTVEIGGETCRRQHIDKIRHKKDYNIILGSGYADVYLIEGIGLVGGKNVGIGNLGAIEMMFDNEHFDACPAPCQLTAVYDGNGDIIFTNPTRYPLPMTSAPAIVSDTMSLEYKTGDRVEASAAGDISLRIIDCSGECVAQGAGYGTAGCTVSMLAPGIYIAVASTPGGAVKTLKIIR